MSRIVVLRAPLLTLSGYGVHARQIGRWLLELEAAGAIELYCEPLQWGNTPWIVDVNRDPTVNKLMNRCKALPRKPDVSVQLQLPNEWNPQLANVNIGVTAAVETDRAHAQWAQACDSMTAVVFPSEHAKKSIVNAGWNPRPNSYFVVPESFPEALLSDPDTSILDPLPEFTFLMVGQMTGGDKPTLDRKKIHETIKWTLEEFAGDEGVGILLKTNMGRNTTFDRYHTEIILRGIVKAAKDKVGNKTLPPVHLVHGDMDDASVAALYKHPNVKCLITATRGEGFGLPILEAAACDLPVIATGWSAHTEFLGLGKFVDLPCKLVDIPPGREDANIFVKGSKWADVSEDDYRRRIRKFRTSSSIPKDWAKALGKIIRERHSPQAISKAWDSAVGSLVRGNL